MEFINNLNQVAFFSLFCLAIVFIVTAGASILGLIFKALKANKVADFIFSGIREVLGPIALAVAIVLVATIWF